MKLENLILLPLLICLACHKAPEYPPVPSISLDNVERFVIQDPNGASDSVIFHLKFKDGDGDLGLETSVQYPPYHTFDFIRDSSGNYIEIGQHDSLPPYTCKEYYIDYLDGDQEIDTVFVKHNPDQHNFFIDFLIKQADGSFEKLDFSNICPDYNGRFPPLSPANYSGPIDGTLSYEPNAGDWRFVLENKTVKFRIQIQDRALNKSNVVETGEIEFTY